MLKRTVYLLGCGSNITRSRMSGCDTAVSGVVDTEEKAIGFCHERPLLHFYVEVRVGIVDTSDLLDIKRRVYGAYP